METPAPEILKIDTTRKTEQQLLVHLNCIRDYLELQTDIICYKM